MRVLIVKLSSMGDLVQALPAITDASRALPAVQFDWVVDESFAEIPKWHPSVGNTLPTAHRRWRKEPLRYWRNGEIRAFVRQLRSSRYDRIIDAQTNIKSAIVTALAKGEKYGPDSHSVREWGAHLAYHHPIALAPKQLAITRLRTLFASALDYTLPDSPPDFGLAATAWPQISIELPTEPYLVCVTNASWSNKRWPDQHWQTLFDMAAERGLQVLLPWGSIEEQQHAQRLAEGRAHCHVLPRLPLGELAVLFQGSRGAVCNDTGLAHIAAALGTPVVTVYGPTDPALIGATGPSSGHLIASDYDCIPCYKRECQVAGYRGPDAQCLKTVTPLQVIGELEALSASTGLSGN